MNGSLTKKEEKGIRKIISIPQNEIIAVYIILYDLEQEKEIKVACSPKRGIEDVYSEI